MIDRLVCTNQSMKPQCQATSQDSAAKAGTSSDDLEAPLTASLSPMGLYLCPDARDDGVYILPSRPGVHDIAQKQLSPGCRDEVDC